MYPHVVVEMFAAHKSLAANITNIRLGAPVDDHVLVTERRRREMFVADSAFERFLPFMNPEKTEMYMTELWSAYIINERLGAPVDDHMLVT